MATYTTYRSFRTQRALPNGKIILDTNGAITAACTVDTETKTMQVGFSFLNPVDPQFKVKGRGQARKRMVRNPIVITNLEVADGHANRLQVTEALIKYLKCTSTQSKDEMFNYLGIKPYNGPSKDCQFLQWFPTVVASL